MAKLPWFPFYPGDWLSSKTVELLTIAQEGAFLRLLAYAWLSNACSIPVDERELRRLAKWDDVDEDFAPVLGCFTPHPSNPNLLHNPRLYAEWLKSKTQHEAYQKRAKAGAKARWSRKSAPQRQRAGLSQIMDLADRTFPPIP